MAGPARAPPPGGTTGPHRQRRPTHACCPALGDQVLEYLEVELSGLHAEQVSGRPRDDPRLVGRRRAERLPQPRDVHLHVVHRGIRRVLAPEGVNDPLARDHSIRTQQQQREQRPLLRPGCRNGQAVHADYERPENPELQAAPRHAAIVLLRGASGQWLGRGWEAPTGASAVGRTPRARPPAYQSGPLQLNRAPDRGIGRGLNPMPDERSPRGSVCTCAWPAQT